MVRQPNVPPMPRKQLKHPAAVLLAALAICGAAPGTVAAAALSPQASSFDSYARPRVMQLAADQVARAKTGALAPFAAAPRATVAAAGTLRREVFGFALASSLADPTLGSPSWNFSLLSTVAFF